MSDLIYQIMWNGAWCDISPNLYKEHPARIRRILYPAATYEAKCNEVAQLEKENAELMKDRQQYANRADLSEKSVGVLQAENAAQTKRIEELEIGRNHLQFLLDSVMLEWCPDEMTEEQMENWSKHQKKSNLEIL